LHRLTVTDGRVSADTPSSSFGGTDVPLNPSEALVTVASRSITTVTDGDGSATDSFVNNVG
jgi:hypothetical protein